MAGTTTWSKDNIEYLIDNYHSMTCAEIGRVVEKTRCAVSGMAFRQKLTKKESNNETNRNTKNKILAFTGYLSTQKSYCGFEPGGREDMEAPLHHAVS